jgi:hypothetical protein
MTPASISIRIISTDSTFILLQCIAPPLRTEIIVPRIQYLIALADPIVQDRPTSYGLARQGRRSHWRLPHYINS